MNATLRREAARCLVIGFDGLTLPDTARALLAEGVGGVILFRRNVASAEQVRSLIAAVREAAPEPLWVSVDQEGGRVARLAGITTDLPPMLSLPDAAAARAAGRRLGRELAALGFDLDLAPVLDVLTNPANTVIGDRAFGRTPAAVIARAIPLLTAMQEAGVAACAKHFPGHGDTTLDSHHDLPVVAHDLDRLRAVELPPFAAAFAAGVTACLVAHVVVRALDPQRPASLSPAVMELLRGELGFDGLVLTDDLEMAAIAGRRSVPEAGVQALAAGADQLLVCHDARRQRATLDAVVDAVAGNRLPRRRLAAAAARVASAMACFPPDRPRPDFPPDGDR